MVRIVRPAARFRIPILVSWAPALSHRQSSVRDSCECYSTVFDRVRSKAMTPGCKIGSLITCQPGTGSYFLYHLHCCDKLFIGKTSSLFYLLVRLLQLRQVVLFTLDGEDLYLFYHGKVYTTTIALLYTTQREYRLPQPKSQTSEVFIWSLFHI